MSFNFYLYCSCALQGLITIVAITKFVQGRSIPFPFSLTVSLILILLRFLLFTHFESE